MNVSKPAALSALVVAGMVATSAFAWPHAPASVPVHWGLGGAPDRWGPRWEALALTPALTAALTVLFAGLPAIMPSRAPLARSATAYVAVWLGVLGLLQVVHAVVVAQALGVALDVSRILGVAVGLLLALMGNYLGKVRYNYVLGVRTPWTLADERVWDRTHRAAGPWFMAWGVALAAAALVWGAPALAAVGGVGALGVTTAAVAYSYLAARRLGAA